MTDKPHTSTVVYLAALRAIVCSLLSAICFALASEATLSSSWPAVGRDLRPINRTGVEGPAD